MSNRWFLSPDNHGQTMINLRRRLYMTVVTSIIICITIIGSYFFWVSYDTPSIAKIVAIVTLIFLSLYIVSLAAMHYMHHYKVVGHFTIFWSIIVLLVSICFLGGGFNTASTSSMILIVIAMGFLILGFYGGLFWAIVAVLFFSVLLYLANTGINFPRITEASPTKNDSTLAWVLTLITLGLLFMAYEWALFKVSNEHGGNQSRLLEKYDANDLAHEIIDQHDITSYLEQSMRRNSHYGDKVSIHNIEISSNTDKLVTAIDEKIYHSALTLARSTDLVLRVGKHQLIAIYENIDSPENHHAIHQELRSRLKQPLYIDGKKIEIKLQLHSSLFPDDVSTVKQLLEKIS